MDVFQKCKSFTRAAEVRKSGLFPYFQPISSAPGSHVTVAGRNVIMIGSNNYMGLTGHPKVKQAAIDAVNKYGSGCTGSRFLNGTLDIHIELESKLARFMGKQAALVFSTGFQTNQGAISTLIGKDDIILIDRANHASIIDGCRLSFGRTIKYRHNDMEDLERLLADCCDESAGVLIVTDGVFSMEGDLANLPKIVELKKKYGAGLMVDDAHGIGVLGKNGRGTAEHFGVEADVDVIMGTFSKSFASLGGFIVAETEVIEYVKHVARALIFSASMPPAAVAAVIAALEIIQTEPERRLKLIANTSKMAEGYTRMGFDTLGSQTPIIPLLIGDDVKCFAFWRALFEAGVFANAIVSPAVPAERSLIRTSYMATHTEEELDKVLEIVGKVGRSLGIIKK
jgi:8-amino-7-oxononanoate synthase